MGGVESAGGAELSRPAGLSAALDTFNAELMHGQYLTGVLAALGGDASGYAAEIAAIARRGSELLSGLLGVRK